jgi:hypothetical protein
MQTSFFIVCFLSLVLVTGILCTGCTLNPGNYQVQPANTTPSSLQTTGQSSTGSTSSELPVVMVTTNAGQSTTTPAGMPDGTIVVSGGQGPRATLTIWKLPPQLSAKVLSGGVLSSDRANVLLSDNRIGNASTYQFSSEFVLPIQAGTYLLEVNQTPGNISGYYLATVVPGAVSDVYIGENAAAAHVSFTISPPDGE